MRKIKFDRSLCITCHSCENACALKHSDAENVGEIVELDLRPTPRITIVERKGKPKMVKCVFCKKPKCVEACPVDAIVQEDDGYVHIQAEVCDGCGACIEACPFDAIRISAEGKSVKCDLCLDLEVPACVDQCPVAALILIE